MKPGELVAGRYRLESRLGVGGMGEVWKATHESTGREFALKFMHAHAATSESARERFAREARASAKINHPNVIDVFDAGGVGEDGTLYMAMELLDGISLADALHLTPPLSVRDLLVVLYDTARALEAAHAVGVIHRDIKPGNIYLHRDRATGFAAAKVLDFGISKFGGDDGRQTKTDAVLGSPRYMSPEQTRSSANVDPRTDLWACGVILFEGLTGRWPHGGDSYSSLVLAICTEEPASIDEAAPQLPAAVREIVHDCLQPRDRRIQSAADLAARIASALDDPRLLEIPLARPTHGASEQRKVVSGMRIRPMLITTADGSSLPTIDLGMDSLRVTRPRRDDARPPDAPVRTSVLERPPDSGSLEPTVDQRAPPRLPLDPTLDTMAATTVREKTPAPGAAPIEASALPDLGSSQPELAGPSRARVGAALAGIFAAVGVAVMAVVGFSSSGDATPTGTASSAARSAESAPSAAASQATVVVQASASTTATADPPHAAKPTASASATVAVASPPARPAPHGPPAGGSKVKQLGSGL